MEFNSNIAMDYLRNILIKYQDEYDFNLNETCLCSFKTGLRRRFQFIEKDYEVHVTGIEQVYFKFVYNYKTEILSVGFSTNEQYLLGMPMCTSRENVVALLVRIVSCINKSNFNFNIIKGVCTNNEKNLPCSIYKYNGRDDIIARYLFRLTLKTDLTGLALKLVLCTDNVESNEKYRGLSCRNASLELNYEKDIIAINVDSLIFDKMFEEDV